MVARVCRHSGYGNPAKIFRVGESVGVRIQAKSPDPGNNVGDLAGRIVGLDTGAACGLWQVEKIRTES